MSKFGLEMDEADVNGSQSANLSERLAAFPLTTPRPRIDLTQIDHAAAAHGFVSREVPEKPAVTAGRRRRIGPVEATRHLAVRLTLPNYDRFVAYADEHRLTYHDALEKLLKDAGW